MGYQPGDIITFIDHRGKNIRSSDAICVYNNCELNPIAIGAIRNNDVVVCIAKCESFMFCVISNPDGTHLCGRVRIFKFVMGNSDYPYGSEYEDCVFTKYSGTLVRVRKLF
jgi:hypothetical protein